MLQILQLLLTMHFGLLVHGCPKRDLCLLDLTCLSLGRHRRRLPWLDKRQLSWQQTSADSTALPVSVKRNHSSGEEEPWESQLEEHQIRGWRRVSAAVLQGEGSPKRSVFFTDTGDTR